MAKRKINVRQHTRKCPSGKKTNVMRHNRMITEAQKLNPRFIRKPARIELSSNDDGSFDVLKNGQKVDVIFTDDATQPYKNVQIDGDIAEIYDDEGNRVDTIYLRDYAQQILDDMKDSDGDGVPDIYDCDPNDPTKQDDFKEVGEVIETAERQQGSIGARLKRLGKRGVSYVSDLARKHKEDTEAFEREVQNLSEKQLEELAVRYKTGLLGGNPYLDELKRRIRTKEQVKSEIAEAKKPRQGLFS